MINLDKYSQLGDPNNFQHFMRNGNSSGGSLSVCRFRHWRLFARRQKAAGVEFRPNVVQFNDFEDMRYCIRDDDEAERCSRGTASRSRARPI